MTTKKNKIKIRRALPPKLLPAVHVLDVDDDTERGWGFVGHVVVGGENGGGRAVGLCGERGLRGDGGGAGTAFPWLREY